MYDFDGSYAQTYKEVCDKCGNIIEVSTQADRNPEYYTEVFIRCKCGESIPFVLPVN